MNGLNCKKKKTSLKKVIQINLRHFKNKMAVTLWMMFSQHRNCDSANFKILNLKRVSLNGLNEIS